MVLLKRYFCPRIKYKSGSSAVESTPPPLNLYADEPFAVTVKSTTGASSGSGKLVKFAPLIAGNAPESFDAVSVEILASATVPVKFPAGKLVSDAPDPEKVVAVQIPVITTPALLVSNYLPPVLPAVLELPQYNSTLKAAPLVTPFSKTLIPG